MEYFCVRCKKKHNIEDIAADRWGIFGEMISDEIVTARMEVADNYIFESESNLLKLLRAMCTSDGDFDKNTSENIVCPVLDKLSSFIRSGENETALTMEFAIKGSDILQNAKPNALEVVSEFYVPFDRILMMYKNSIPPKDSEAKQMLEQFISLKKEWEGIFSGESIDLYKTKLYYDFVPAGDTRVYLMAKNDKRLPFERKIEDKMFQTAYSRCCPYCGYKLSRSAGTAPEIVIALEGCPRAGKTSGMIAAINALETGAYRGLEMDFMDKSDPANRFLITQMERFKKGYKVLKTPATSGDPPVTSVTVLVGDTVKRVLTFVDMPGEFWQSADFDNLPQEFYKEYMDLIESCDCLWFLIPKMALYNADFLNEINSDMKAGTADEAEDLAKANANNLSLKLKAIDAQMQIKKRKIPPVAVIISKPEFYTSSGCGNTGEAQDEYDKKMLAELKAQGLFSQRTDEQVLDYKPNSNNPSLMEKEFFEKSIQVKKFIEKTEKDFITAFSFCPEKFYISSAAYGHPAADPEKKEEIPTPPMQFHEVYPLLWTLAISGVLKIKHNCEWTKHDLFGRATGNTVLAKETVRFSRNKGVFWVHGNRAAELEALYNNVGANLFMRNANSKYQTTKLKREKP